MCWLMEILKEVKVWIFLAGDAECGVNDEKTYGTFTFSEVYIPHLDMPKIIKNVPGE